MVVTANLFGDILTDEASQIAGSMGMLASASIGDGTGVAEKLGASNMQYWWRGALPVLLPSILGSMILLLGNAFGAYATAYALTGGALPIVTIQIGAQIRGDVLHNPGLGYAMAMGMVVIMAISLAGYSWLESKSERWLK